MMTAISDGNSFIVFLPRHFVDRTACAGWLVRKRFEFILVYCFLNLVLELMQLHAAVRPGSALTGRLLGFLF